MRCCPLPYRMTGRTSLLGVTEAGSAIAPFFSASKASAAAKQKDQNDNSSQYPIAHTVAIIKFCAFDCFAKIE